MPSLGSSSGRRRSSRPSAARRRAVRFEVGSTAYSCRNSSSTAASVNQSSRGPSRSGSSSTSGRARGTAFAATASVSSASVGAWAARPVASCAPSPIGSGPSPVEGVRGPAAQDGRHVDASGDGEPGPDAVPRRADLDELVGAHRHRSPHATGRPATVTPTWAPVTAIRVGRCARSRTPPSRISSPAASGPLPTSRLARASASGSRAPDGGTPRWLDPERPWSCTSRNGPGSSTSNVIGSPSGT